MKSAPFSFLLVGLGVLAAASCANNTRDSHCTPDETDPETTDCIYAGKGEGPLVSEAACAALVGEKPAVCPSFYEVLEVFNDPAKGNCSSTGCHGREENASDGIFLPLDDAERFYDELLGVRGSVGTPYVIADDPATGGNESLSSWIHCNLHATPGGGFPMPPSSGLLLEADRKLVEDWLLCGAPAPPVCTANAEDGACVSCAKDACCGQVLTCSGDADCLACVQCIQMSGLGACAAECDEANSAVAALRTCLSTGCSEVCPQ
jgi:hypothetical protein